MLFESMSLLLMLLLLLLLFKLGREVGSMDFEQLSSFSRGFFIDFDSSSFTGGLRSELVFTVNVLDVVESASTGLLKNIIQ